MVNPVRGEQVLEIAGQRHVLCLTLGALAEIEAIGSEAGRLDARKLLRVLGAFLRAGANPTHDRRFVKVCLYSFLSILLRFRTP